MRMTHEQKVQEKELEHELALEIHQMAKDIVAMKELFEPVPGYFDRLIAHIVKQGERAAHIDTPVQISSTIPYTLEYRQRKYVYVFNQTTSPVTLQLENLATITVASGTWENVSFPEGIHIYAPTFTGGATFNPIFRATDELLATHVGLLPGAASVGFVSLNAGTNTIGNMNSTSDYPVGAVPLTGASGNQANAVATATLAGVAGKTTYITGFEVTGSGATGALVVTVTVTGTISGTLSYTYVFVAGATLANESLIVEFTKAIPASAANVAIVVSCPASGLGGTNNTVVAHGYQL